MRANDPRGVANLDPGDMVGRIYVGEHFTMLHTKYISCGPHVFREDFSPTISLWKLMNPGAWPIWMPGT